MLEECPEMMAQYERILASACAIEGDRGAAQGHYARAKRICRTLENVPAELELAAYCGDLAAAPADEAAEPPVAGAPMTAASVVHAVAAVLANSARPELAGFELLAILNGAGCVDAASLIAVGETGAQEVIHRLGAQTAKGGTRRELSLGSSRGRDITLVVRPRADTEAIATLNAVTVLIGTMHELQRARVEREERATLWPTDELPLEGDRAVISGHMRELMSLARRIAKTNVNVLITGESGTGKEILARAIHDFSDRTQKPFVAVNCAAVPRELLESQLFGHRRGAFTGADRDYLGFIRAARDGTLFLDEIGELGLDLQPKLLRFLESREIAPLGDTAPVTVDVRIIAATNMNLEERVREGRFRDDLFYRLTVVPLTIKPLRERRDEIPGLVHHFVQRAAVEFKKGHITVAEETMERLLLYRWPGNIRQLQNELCRMVALAETDSTLQPDAISDDILGALPQLRRASNGSEMAVSLHDKLPPTLARIESEMIRLALREHRGRVDAAARALGISRKGLYLKRQRLGL
jgi:transcriptional regulator with PAS, ATPase and Fis domain